MIALKLSYFVLFNQRVVNVKKSVQTSARVNRLLHLYFYFNETQNVRFWLKKECDVKFSFSFQKLLQNKLKVLQKKL